VQREPGEPDPVDEFERIVSGWRREKSVPAWPEEPSGSEPPDGADAPPAVPRPPRPAPHLDEPPHVSHIPPEDVPPDQQPDDDAHFVPPEPPPLPPVGPPALVGLGLLALGVVLVAAPWWIGVPDAYGLPLGLLTLASGLGWLVLRLWPDPPQCGDGDGEDDGARL